MMKRALAGLAAMVLSACIGVQQAPQVASYGAAAIAPKADANGWYTFGQTRFKGALLDGAPHGAGLCIESHSYRGTSLPCNFAKGVRIDADYLAEKQGEISDKRRREDQERRERAAWEAKEAREMAQARKEANAMLAADLAKMPARMADQMARVDAASRGTSVEEERAKAQRRIEFDARIAEQAADPNSEMNQAKRRDAQRAEASREASEKADTQRRKLEAERKNMRVADEQKSTAEDKRSEEKERVAAAKKEADEKALKEKQERERARVEAERVAREEARKLEQERVAAAAAAKAAAQAKLDAEREAKSAYLRELAQSTKLRARTCFGPKYYVVGIRPKISPKPVDCVNLRYRARCEGSSGGHEGVLKNFLGVSTDCYMGDTAEMDPTPACKVDQVRIEVLSASGCFE